MGSGLARGALFVGDKSPNAEGCDESQQSTVEAAQAVVECEELSPPGWRAEQALPVYFGSPRLDA